MKNARVWFVGVAVMLVGWFSVGNARAAGGRGESYAVKSVVIEGTQRIDTAAVRAQIKSIPGTVSAETVSADIKAIYATGFFAQVSAAVVPDAPGGPALTFTLVEKPVVRKVFIKGNEEVDEKDLTEVFKFGTNRFLDRARVDALIRNAVSFYQGKGFYDAAFEYTAVPVTENQVDLTFTVTEGRKFTIDSITFRGLKEVDADDLADVIQTREHSWYKSWLLGTGRLNKEMLENDRLVLRQWLLDNGYIDGVVSEPQIEAADGQLAIVFDVQEGQRYRLGTVTVSGDLIEGSIEKTLAGTSLEAGEIFSASKIREDSFTISDKFSDEGFAFANVVPGTSVSKATGTVDIDYVVS